MIGVDRNKVDTAEKIARHARNSIAAAAADADHLHVCRERLKLTIRFILVVGWTSYARAGFFGFHMRFILTENRLYATREIYRKKHRTEHILTASRDNDLR